MTINETAVRERVSQIKSNIQKAWDKLSAAEIEKNKDDVLGDIKSDQKVIPAKVPPAIKSMEVLDSM